MNFATIVDVGRLQDVDRLARRTKYCTLPRFRYSSSTAKLSRPLLRSTPSSPDGLRAPPILQKKPSKASEIFVNDSQGDFKSDTTNVDENVCDSKSGKFKPPTVDDLLTDLEAIISKPDPYPTYVTIFAQGLQSSLVRGANCRVNSSRILN